MQNAAEIQGIMAYVDGYRYLVEVQHPFLAVDLYREFRNVLGEAYDVQNMKLVYCRNLIDEQDSSPDALNKFRDGGGRLFDKEIVVYNTQIKKEKISIRVPGGNIELEVFYGDTIEKLYDDVLAKHQEQYPEMFEAIKGNIVLMHKGRRVSRSTCPILKHIISKDFSFQEDTEKRLVKQKEKESVVPEVATSNANMASSALSQVLVAPKERGALQLDMLAAVSNIDSILSKYPNMGRFEAGYLEVIKNHFNNLANAVGDEAKLQALQNSLCAHRQ